MAPGPRFNPDVARLGTGSVVAWEDGNSSDISFRIFNSSGIGGNGITANSITPNTLQNQPTIAVSTDQSSIAIAWFDQADLNIRARIFNQNGTDLGPEFLINEAIPFPIIGDP